MYPHVYFAKKYHGRLEDDIKTSMFVVVPTSNVFKKLGTWLRVWQLLYLAFGVDKLRVGLQVIVPSLTYRC